MKADTKLLYLEIVGAQLPSLAKTRPDEHARRKEARKKIPDMKNYNTAANAWRRYLSAEIPPDSKPAPFVWYLKNSTAKNSTLENCVLDVLATCTKWALQENSAGFDFLPKRSKGLMQMLGLKTKSFFGVAASGNWFEPSIEDMTIHVMETLLGMFITKPPAQLLEEVTEEKDKIRKLEDALKQEQEEKKELEKKLAAGVPVGALDSLPEPAPAPAVPEPAPAPAVPEPAPAPAVPEPAPAPAVPEPVLGPAASASVVLEPSPVPMSAELASLRKKYSQLMAKNRELEKAALALQPGGNQSSNLGEVQGLRATVQKQKVIIDEQEERIEKLQKLVEDQRYAMQHLQQKLTEANIEVSTPNNPLPGPAAAAAAAEAQAENAETALVPLSKAQMEQWDFIVKVCMGAPDPLKKLKLSMVGKLWELMNTIDPSIAPSDQKFPVLLNILKSSKNGKLASLYQLLLKFPEKK